MMKRIIFLSILVPFMVSASAAAGDFQFHTVRYNLPKVETTVLDGIDYKCLDTKQWQGIQVMGRQYHGLYDWRLEIQGIIAAHKVVVEGYKLMIKGYERLIAARDKMILYWKDRVGDLEKQLALNLFKGKVENYILWAIVAVESVLMIALGVYTYVEVFKGSDPTP
jgi:hypothetical protein